MNAMKKLIAYYGDSPVYVEGFSKDCARSCEGSVHVLPRKPVTVTSDEYEHIKKSYSWMLPKLKVVAEIGEDKKSKDVDSGKPESSSKAKSEPTDATRKRKKLKNTSDSDGRKPAKKKKKSGKK